MDSNVLSSMKRAKLQKLAKKIGIKANQTNKELINALQDHYLEKTQSIEPDSHATTPGLSTSDKEQSLICISESFKSDKNIKKIGTSPPISTIILDKQTRRRTRTLSGPKDLTKSSTPSIHENTPITLNDRNTKKQDIKKYINEHHDGIPRFSTYLNKKTTLSTPKNWNIIHQKKFENLESIDDYLNRKKKRQEHLSSSVKTPKISRIPELTMKRSAIFTKGEINTNSPSLISKQPLCLKGQPEVNKLNHVSDTPQKITLNKTPNCSKKAFNLEESLRKPLNYKPYKGPIKALNNGTSKPAHPKDLKKPMIKNSQTRLAEKMMKQKELRASILMRHRKII